MYKNPKKAAPRGASAMQPSTAAAGAGAVRRVRADVQETPLNVEGWWRRGEGGVPADQVRCVVTRQKTHTHSHHVPVAGIFPAVFCTEACEGAREGDKSRQAQV